MMPRLASNLRYNTVSHANSYFARQDAPWHWPCLGGAASVREGHETFTYERLASKVERPD